MAAGRWVPWLALMTILFLFPWWAAGGFVAIKEHF
jgi:hypothetical protein